MQDENLHTGGTGRHGRRAAALLLAGAALLSTLSGCSTNLNLGDIVHPTETAAPETVPTEPPATIPPDGDPENVSCRGSYTVERADGSQVVASIEDQELTNGKLNILYRLAVSSYQAREGEPAPDFEKPLDTQVCELPGDHVTWQQYFIQKAIDNWQSIQSLERRSHMPMVRNEKYFEVDQAKHTQYMTDMPINERVLYDEDATFQLNKKDQAYMDELEDHLGKVARDKGYSGIRDLVSGEFGSNAAEKDFLELAELMNYAYFYFIDQTYFDLTEEEMDAALAQIPAAAGDLVDFRHILVYDEEAMTVGPDGRVTGSEEAWDASRKLAEDLVKKFNTGKKKDDTAFSVLAHANTKDEGSRLTGGMYVNVHKGQLIAPLDAWCFNPARKPGDIDIVKSDFGYHVLYLKDKKDGRTLEAEEAAKQAKLKLIMEECTYNYPMTLDYSKIQLEPMEEKSSLVLEQDLLYNDQGHERFPEVPVYIQQDYPKAPYGGYKLTTHGCGISAFAMLSTYMMDDLLTPAALAQQFGHYNGLHGTDWKMFTEAPPVLGYFLYERANAWKTVEEGLKNGRMAISLQVKGYFTRAGHYLVISELLDDGRVVIRDSNIYNYVRLREHKEDKFNPQKLLPNCQGFWIYDNKVVTVPNCSRCGDGDRYQGPSLFKEDDYICHRCTPAMERREAFLNLCRFA